MTARRAHAYPQVEPGAAGLVDTALAAVPRSATVAETLRATRRHQAPVAAVGDQLVLRDDLARASALGLDDLAAAALARPLPVVDAGATESALRRKLAAGAPLVVVRGRQGLLGAVARPGSAAPDGPSLGLRFAARLSPATAALVAAVRRVAASLGARAYLAGGLVRDALASDRPPPARDVDVVVEGDGLALARLLAHELGASGAGALVEHERFLTASVTAPGGLRVDVVTARSERYEEPGALPRVLPATIAADLGRRDFTVNAMAVELASGTFALLDPHGGRQALARRRLAVLHPLSFVEDPTRLFRAARYGARLDFPLDPWTQRAQGLAVRLAPYPALSGHRLTAEIALIMAEPGAPLALARLGRAQVFRLLDPRYRFGARSAARLQALGAGLDWIRRHRLRVTPLELGLLALLAEQPPEVTRDALGRLGLQGEPLDRLGRALAGALAPAPGAPASERARRLRDRSDVELAALWLGDGPGARAEVEWFVGRARGVRPALDGDDVVRLGVAPGPGVARALAALRDARLDGRVQGRDQEAALVRDFQGRREEG